MFKVLGEKNPTVTYRKFGYGWNVLTRIVLISNRFTCEISTSTETKSWKKKLPELQLLVKPKLKSFKAHFAAFIIDSF